MLIERLNCIVFFSSIFFCQASAAQSIAPESGQITVRLIQGLDSEVARPGQASAGTVVRSTNSAVPARSSAVVRLVADPAGGFAVQLVQLGVNGQTFRTASSGAVLAGGLVGKLNNKLRAPGAPQDSVSGTRVFLPSGTDVQFALTTPTEAPARARRAPPQVSQRTPPVAPTPQTSPAVPPPSTWRFQTMSDGGHEAVIPGVAESGERRGPAMLAVQCKVNSPLGSPGAYATVGYEIRMPRGLVGFPTDALSCFGDGAGNDYAHIQVGAQPEKHGDFCYGDELPPNPNQTVAMQIVPPDPKSPVMSPGNSFQIGLRLPDTQTDAMVARFQLPQDASALQAMTKSCFDILDENERREKAARVLACPEVPGKTLQNVEVLVGPAMTKLQPDGDNDIGTAWNLPKKNKAHPVPPKTTLACYYAAGATPPGDAHRALEKRLLPIPATAAYCVFREDGHCSTAEGRN